MEKFHERAREAMKNKQMTYNTLARRLQVSKPTAWAWLNTEWPPVERIIQICNVLELTITIE